MPSNFTRRCFMSLCASATLVAAGTRLLGPSVAHAADAPDAFPMPPLPYPENGLEPAISARTISFHYGKHTAAYYANMNKAVAGTPLASMKLEEVVKSVAGDPAKAGLFNNAAQSWNHTFYWAGMKPGGGGTPPAKVADALSAAFGSVDACVTQLSDAAKTQFASGLAGQGPRKRQGRAEGTEDRQRRKSHHPRLYPHPHHRRVGTRLLPGLPEQAPRLRPGLLRQTGELGRSGQAVVDPHLLTIPKKETGEGTF